MLALISKFDPTEARKALVFLVSCSVRFTIVGQLGSTLLENLYADTGKLVRDGEIKTATELADYLLSKGVPNDKDFCSAFAIAKVSSTSHARYYLRTLQVFSAGKKEQEFVPNQNREIINLEHVLPQNIDPDNWKHFDQEQVHAFCNRIGNLALLKLKDNSVIGNKSFDLKKEVYKNSEYTLTQALAVVDIWTPAAIEKRQMSMAELALKAWPLKMQG